MTSFLDRDDVLVAGAAAIGEVPAVADYGLLDSAIARPRATVFGLDAYPDLFAKAAALLESLACNHALVDGNKRTAWAGVDKRRAKSHRRRPVDGQRRHGVLACTHPVSGVRAGQRCQAR